MVQSEFLSPHHVLDMSGHLVSVGRVDNETVVLVLVDLAEDDVGVEFKDGGVEMSVHFERVEMPSRVSVDKLSNIHRLEGVGIVPHFRSFFLSQSHQFKHLSTDLTSLKRSFPQHEPHHFVGFVVILTRASRAPHVPEGHVRCEHHQRVVDGSKVCGLSVFHWVEHELVVRVTVEEGCPFLGNLVKGLGSHVYHFAFFNVSWADNCLNMLDWSIDLLV